MVIVGFFDRFLGRKSATMSSLDLYREMLAGAASRSGVQVTHKTALQASVAFACARVIAEGMSSIPFRLMRKDESSRGPAVEHPLFDLMASRPNELQSPVDFLDTVGLHLAFAGNAYVWAIRGAGRAVIELLPLEPRMVVPRNERGEMRYQVTLDNAQPVEMTSDDLWHIRGPSWNGWKGLDGIELAREAVGLSMAGESHGASTFSNGAKLSGVLTTDATLTKEQRDQLRQSWQETYSGASNAFKTAVMSHGMKFAPLSATNVDAQWLEGRRFQIEEVCRFFRVMPIMVGYSDKTATYASAEAMFEAHVRYTMLPWYRRIEASADRWLLSPKERASGLYWKFFPAGLLRANPKDRGEFYAKLYGIGALNPNEIRELEDMNPYQGGDQYRVPLNMVDPLAPLPEPAPPPSDEPKQVINVSPPSVTVEGATINVATPAVKMDAPQVHVDAPTVNVAPPAITINPSPVSVSVDAKRGAVRKSVSYDDDGNITGVEESPIED